MNEEEKIKGYRRKTDQLIKDKCDLDLGYARLAGEEPEGRENFPWKNLVKAGRARMHLDTHYSKNWPVDEYTKFVKYLEIILRLTSIASRTESQLARDAYNNATQKYLDSLDITIDEWLTKGELWDGDIKSFKEAHSKRSGWMSSLQEVEEQQQEEEPGSSMSNTARRAARGAARGAAVARAAAGKLWRKMTPQHAEPPQQDDEPSEWGGGSKRRIPKRTKRRPSRSRPKLSKKKKTKKSKNKRKKTRRRRR